MTRRLRGVGLMATVLVAGSCAAGTTRDPSERPGNSNDPITREEIDRGQWTNSLELVRSVRPGWVRGRGPDSFADPGQVQVYVDGTRLGDIDLLATLPTHAIVRIEWVDPVSAAGRWGMDHGHGVIHVIYGRTDPPEADEPPSSTPRPETEPWRRR